MNLSSYLQMPPAPSASKSPATSPVSGPAAGARVDAGNSLGLDFAQIMSRQLERLPQMHRQNLAAPEPQAPPAQEATNAHQTQKRADSEDRNGERTSREDDAKASQRTSQRDEGNDSRDAQDASDTPASAEARPHKTRQVQKVQTAQEHMDAALLQAMSVLPASATPVTNDPVAQASTLIAGKPSLQTIALSPQIQIITDPKQAPSNESLAEFAKSMGLDEAAIQSLIANGANARPTVGEAGTLNAALAQANAANPLAQSASHALMAALQSNAAAQSTDMAAANLAAVTQASQGSASLLAPDVQGMPGALLPPMSAADLASIESIQITIMPAVIAGGNATVTSALPSTQDVLSLLTGELKEPDISKLSALFNEAGGNEQPADQQHSSSNTPNTPFAQVLSSSTGNTTAQPSANAQATSATHMSEVYDQLSDKLATEMAGRLHKQLSDGEWKMKFGLRPAHLGGVEIQLEMKDGKLDAVFRADNPLTRDLLQNSSQRLREALENFGIHAGQVHVGQQGGQGQQNASRNSANQPQVGDNSTLQVKGDESVTSTTVASNKANASLLDLYA
jgi:flagellar hook-length control protein FliK